MIYGLLIALISCVSIAMFFIALSIEKPFLLIPGYIFASLGIIGGIIGFGFYIFVIGI